MRSFNMKTATVALLGLGSVFSGVVAAPTPHGAVERRSSNNKLATRADPPNVEDKYKVEGDSDEYQVKTKDGSFTVDIVEIDGKTIIVENADNSNDPTEGRLRLFEICGYLYKKAGGTLSELETFKTTSTIEESVQTAVEQAWSKLELDDDEDGFEVKSDDDGAKKEVYDLFATGTVFGSSAQHYTSDYGAQPITSIKLSEGKSFPTIEWNFG